ncbi:MAG: hypothetical protein ABI434_00370 [Burkholderiaceae bacterium]
MAKPFKEWKVLPHSKLWEVDENILTVVGRLHLPFAELPRRMTVVRLHDGGLVIFSAIALDEDEMVALEEYGTPAFLVVPSSRHRMDAHIWMKRYPNMRVATPAGAQDKVEETVGVDTTAPDFGDPNVVFETVGGSHDSEAALRVHSTHGTTLVLGDMVGNIHDESGFGGWVLRVTGFAGDAPQVPRVVKVSADAAALRSQLLEWAAIESLHCILVAHGDPISDDPHGVLRKLADSLT